MPGLVKAVVLVLLGAALGAAGALSYAWGIPFLAEPKSLSKYPVSCDPFDRDECWQRGRRVETPDPYERCTPGIHTTPGVVGGTWIIAGDDDPGGPFGATYACAPAGD